MKTVAILLSLALVGCATPPQWLASYYNNQDACQSQNWYKNGGQQPRYCGAGSARTYIYTTPHQAPLGYQSGYVKK